MDADDLGATISLRELRRRAERSLEAARAEAHADVDRMFDGIAAQQSAELARIATMELDDLAPGELPLPDVANAPKALQ